MKKAKNEAYIRNTMGNLYATTEDARNDLMKVDGLNYSAANDVIRAARKRRGIHLKNSGRHFIKKSTK